MKNNYEQATVQALADRYISHMAIWHEKKDLKSLYAAYHYLDAGCDRLGTEAFNALISHTLTLPCVIGSPS